MNNSKDERMKCLKDMGYRMWDKGLWDQRIGLLLSNAHGNG